MLMYDAQILLNIVKTKTLLLC